MVCIDSVGKNSCARVANRTDSSCFRRHSAARAGRSYLKTDSVAEADDPPPDLNDARRRLSRLMSLDQGDYAVSEREVKVGLNGTNKTNGMPQFGFGKIAFGDFAGQGVARAQEGCDRIKAASEAVAETLSETYSSNAKRATDYGLKVIEMSKDNTASAIDFFADLLTSKSVTDVFTLSATHARKAFDTASAQNRELWGLAQKLATETSEPIRKHVAKVFNQAS